MTQSHCGELEGESHVRKDTTSTLPSCQHDLEDLRLEQSVEHSHSQRIQ
jgi:hypothetical protein